MKRLLVALAALVVAMPGPAQAWGFFAHGVTAKVAMANSSPSVRREVYLLMQHQEQLGTPKCPITTIDELATWADCVRNTRWRWGHTSPWHYRQTPICEDYDPWANCFGGNCVTGQIVRNHRILADESLPAPIRLQALAFMVHFAGDIHMPLHSGDKDDRGGNDRITDYGIVPDLNLHRIWDSQLAERAITTGPLPTIRRYSAAERAELGGGTPPDWGRESWSISRSFVYPTAFDTEDVCATELPMKTALTQEDIVRGVPIAKRRVQQAGLRIAELLESAFAPGPLPPPERD
ncbi:S1/P1 nuclease [Erythrobacter sp. GH1-10]|uniref:S1/P1 nuclease n=1 Tax=Erythrobacter sp. GH1-10 TaxID=3349334 RepID=UPI003877990A